MMTNIHRLADNNVTGDTATGSSTTLVPFSDRHFGGIPNDNVIFDYGSSSGFMPIRVYHSTPQWYYSSLQIRSTEKIISKSSIKLEKIIWLIFCKNSYHFSCIQRCTCDFVGNIYTSKYDIFAWVVKESWRCCWVSDGTLCFSFL